MTRQRKLKKQIRARMAETGERYTTARAAILKERSERQAAEQPRQQPHPEEGRKAEG